MCARTFLQDALPHVVPMRLRLEHAMPLYQGAGKQATELQLLFEVRCCSCSSLLLLMLLLLLLLMIMMMMMMVMVMVVIEGDDDAK